MASERQIAANRLNALKSTGPRTEAGKARSRKNAITHGLSTHVENLPDDEKDAFEQRVTSWKAALQPCTPYEDDLVRRLAGYSWRLDRAERVQTALIADSIDEAEQDDVRRKREAFGDAARRLLPDFAPEGAPEPAPDPRQLIGEHYFVVDDLNDPLLLVMQLERVAEGCVWLRERWAELRAVLEGGKAWSDPELIRALRLSGHRPLDAAEDFGVLEIIVANYVTDRSRPDPFSALWDGLNPLEMNRYRKRLIGRRLQDAMPESPEAARDFLLDLIDETTARLEETEAELRARDAEVAEVRPAAHLFDDSTEGQWLRLKQLQYDHAIARIVERFTKARRRGLVMTADPPPRRRPEKPKPPPPRLVDQIPKPTLSPRDQMAKERRKKGVRWRTHKVPPWRGPGGRYLFRQYPGYPPIPQPVRRRRKMSAKRKRRMAKGFIRLFEILGLWTVLIALLLGAEGLPGRTTDSPDGPGRPGFRLPESPSGSLARLDGGVEQDGPTYVKTTGQTDRMRWSPFRVIRVFRGSISVLMADRKTFHHEGHESKPVSHSCSSCSSWHSWFNDPTPAVSQAGGGRTTLAERFFRLSAAWTPGKMQNEPNFGRDSGFLATAEPASAHPSDRSRGPPRSQIAAIFAARPPPKAPFTVPHEPGAHRDDRRADLAATSLSPA
jgi:hypothetical protein